MLKRPDKCSGCLFYVKIGYICVMSKKWARSFSIIVLVSFVALLLPKSLWHDCSHLAHSATEKGTHSKAAIDQGIEKCYACDLHIPLLSNPLAHQPSIEKTVVQQSSNAIPQVVPFGIVSTTSLRGPPAEMM